MPRKIYIRRAETNSSIYQLEKQVKNMYKDILKDHLEDLKEVADMIQSGAEELCPVYMGEERKDGSLYYNPVVVPEMLKQSISVRVSKSYRYPGIIASASARNMGKRFDYALIQDYDESFAHIQGSAHYLSAPFVVELSLFYQYITHKELKLPQELARIRDGGWY